MVADHEYDVYFVVLNVQTLSQQEVTRLQK